MEIEIVIPKALWEQLNAEALQRNTSAEDFIATAIKNFIERNDNNHAK